MSFKIKKICARSRLSEEAFEGADTCYMADAVKEMVDDIVRRLLDSNCINYDVGYVYDNEGNKLPYIDIVAYLRVVTKNAIDKDKRINFCENKK